jgi:hypothetical protein
MKSIEPARAVAKLFEESWGVEGDEDEDVAESDQSQEETVVVETGTVAPATVTRTSHVA